MVIKTCKICGKEFDAKGSDKTCSIECRRIKNLNYCKKYNQSEAGKARNRKYQKSDKCKATQKKYNQSEAGKARNRKYQQSDKCKTTKKKYNQSAEGKLVRAKSNKKYQQKKINKLKEKYDGDLNLILKDCPNIWLVREAIMQVEYGKSYAEAMYQKMEANPVCEITGRKDNLVNHHLDSFDIHPEKGADLDNIVRIVDEIHMDFHSIYGYGSNTREQWFEFMEENRNLYI